MAIPPEPRTQALGTCVEDRDTKALQDTFLDMLVFWYEMVKGQKEHSRVGLAQYPRPFSGV